MNTETVISTGTVALPEASSFNRSCRIILYLALAYHILVVRMELDLHKVFVMSAGVAWLIGAFCVYMDKKGKLVISAVILFTACMSFIPEDYSLDRPAEKLALEACLVMVTGVISALIGKVRW